MPNWCLNKLKITGSEQAVAAVKALVLNEKGVVDFEVACPVPAPIIGLTNSYIPGILNSFDHLPNIDFKFHDDNPDRMSLATPENFMAAVSLFCEKNDTEGLLDDLESESFTKWLAESDIIKPNTAIETSISDAVNAWRKLPDEERQLKSSPLSDDLVHLIMNVLSVENSAYCEKTYGYEQEYYWAIANWGTKWNVSESYPIEDLGEASIGFEFGTAWSFPSQWLYSLVTQAKALTDSDVEIELCYAEGGMWFGGRAGLDSAGSIYEITWGDDEIIEFLGEEEDCDEDYE